MPLPRALARFNRHVTNPLLGGLFGRRPPFAIVVHRGRTSGRSYRTPVWAFPVPDGFAVALTYGADSQWVRNVLAADGCVLERRGELLTAVSPEVRPLEDVTQHLPAPVRPALTGMRLEHVLVLRVLV